MVVRRPLYNHDVETKYHLFLICVHILLFWHLISDCLAWRLIELVMKAYSNLLVELEALKFRI